MTLTPHEILKYLGIEVPQEGITINPNDEFLYTQFLRVLGNRMTVDAILVGELTYLDTGLHEAAGRAREVGGEPPTDEQLERLRTTLRLIQSKDLGMTVA
ncbi:hypothetical protein CFM90_26370 (plasmid) [Ralstonia solanacearum]|nr:hypothetical protein CFM90_26370 [Ralstonia solanacearum]